MLGAGYHLEADWITFN